MPRYANATGRSGGGATGRTKRRHPQSSTPVRRRHPNISPSARRRLFALGLDRNVPAVELRAGRIVASILAPCRLHCYPDGRLFVELARRLPGSPERMAHHASGAQLARAVAAGGGQ